MGLAFSLWVFAAEVLLSTLGPYVKLLLKTKLNVTADILRTRRCGIVSSLGEANKNLVVDSNIDYTSR